MCFRTAAALDGAGSAQPRDWRSLTMWWHDHCVRRDRERGFPFNPAPKKYWQRVKSELASFTVAEREYLVGRMQADGRAARSKRKAHDALSLAALPGLELCDSDDQGGAAVVLHEDTT